MLRSPTKGLATTATARAINAAWAASCRRERRRFLTATDDVAAVQGRLLADIVEANVASDAGRRYRFDKCLAAHQNLLDEFRFRVPPTTYDDLAPDIERIADGEPNVLTTEPVTILQPTSGSTGGRKLIPLTATVQRQFQRAISAWIGDLYTARPGVRRGRAYWSISPAMAPTTPSAGRIPVGFADDTEYLGGIERLAVNRVLAVPSDAVRSATIDSFRRRTLAHLLVAPDLALISVWSPTFLTALVDELLNDPGAAIALATKLDRRAARHAAEILRSSAPDHEKLARLWPKLDTISCWADGAAAGFLQAVHERFPHVAVQPKGLLATEAFLSFPLEGHRGAALAVRSHFFEFDPVGGGGPTLLAHQLDVGGRYQPLVTTGGGLYRYRLGDVVEVVGNVGGCPLIRFVGRAATADLVGEKLDDAFASHAVSSVLASQAPSLIAAASNGASPDALLLPVAMSSTPRYVLTIERSAIARGSGSYLLDGRAEWAELQPVADALDAQLRANPHYAYARDVGQLAPVAVVTTPPGTTPRGLYEAVMTGRGVRVGDIKPVTLVTAPDIAAQLAAVTLGRTPADAAS
ncbi:MAG: GH3 family domain-containing protein [Acidimicrobiales bacterium]